MEAALLLDWMVGAVKSYYGGNDFIVMSQSTNSTIRGMSVSVSLRRHSSPIDIVGRYSDLCRFVNGRYQ
jgi:hypothetical protein